MPEYTLTTPAFDKITIKRDPKYYGRDRLVIERVYGPGESGWGFIDHIRMGDKECGYRINHNDLVKAGTLTFKLQAPADMK